MDLKTLLISSVPREESGSTTSDRYDFQKNWALCEILTRHDTGEDYCVVLEHHEDVMVLDSEHEPTSVELFQVKSRDGTHWTLGQLLKRPKGGQGPKLSFLGRLVGKDLIFGASARGLYFVSNLPFQVALASGRSSTTATNIRLTELAPKPRSMIERRLKTEHAPASLGSYLDRTHLRRCALPLKEHDQHAQGLLADFLDRRTPGVPYAVRTIYRALFDEVRMKTNFQGACVTLEDLVASRSISRRHFDAILADITRPRNLDDLWKLALATLKDDGMPLRRIIRIGQAKLRYETDMVSSSNLAVNSLRKAVRSAVAALPDKDIPLIQLLGEVRTALPSEHEPLIETLGAEYVDACILFEFLSLTSAGISSAGAQPAPEAA
jgi:hypothetical protein